MRRRILFYVQHLKGIGHIVRSGRIVEALVADGLDVTVAFGGVPVAGFDFDGASVHQLPPIRSQDGGFSTLLDEAGEIVDEAYKQRRRGALLALYDAVQPDLVVTEMFPLGRRAMRFELMPLIERVAADPRRPRLAASVRDILQAPKSAERAAEQVALVNRFYDLVLVHGDPHFARIEDSLPGAALLADRIRYTGLVGPRLDPLTVPEAQRTDVVVSVGGGAVGMEILSAAIAAKPMTTLADRRWLMLTGPNAPPAVAATLKIACDAHDITLETYRRNLPETMQHALLSIQMGGYNTVCDALAAGCRAVIIPYVEAGETEQRARARRLAELQRAVVVEVGSIDPCSLATAIDAAVALPEPASSAAAALSLDGARESARLLSELIAKPR